MTRFFCYAKTLSFVVAVSGWRPDPWKEPNNWVDPDSPKSAHTVLNLKDGEQYDLIFSDEFNTEGRDFRDGKDPKWTALDRPDTVNGPLEYYSSKMVTTKNGMLDIKTTNEPITWTGWNDNTGQEEEFFKPYKSGMIQGFNKYCFTGGIIEVSMQLPGTGDLPGLWPAAWLMGNLGRATYTQTTAGLWPWSFNHCMKKEDHIGVPDSIGEGQRLSACNGSPEKGLNPNQGRGATEIDIMEAMATETFSGFTTSLQVSPPIPTELRPEQGSWPKPDQWYKRLSFGNGAELNTAYYGPSNADAVSANVGTIGGTYYSQQHVWRLEWVPGVVGYIRWYIDNKFLFEIPAASLAEDYMGTPSRKIPEEPMYLIFNTAISNNWSPVCKDWNEHRCPPGSTEPCCMLFPAHFLVDYVRVYQNKKNVNMTRGCDPEAYPTKEYIENHAEFYAPLPIEVPPPLPVDTVRAYYWLEVCTIALAAITILVAACTYGCVTLQRRSQYSKIRSI